MSDSFLDKLTKIALDRMEDNHKKLTKIALDAMEASHTKMLNMFSIYTSTILGPLPEKSIEPLPEKSENKEMPSIKEDTRPFDIRLSDYLSAREEQTKEFTKKLD